MEEGEEGELDLAKVPEVRDRDAHDRKAVRQVAELGDKGGSLRLENADEDTKGENGGERMGVRVQEEKEHPLGRDDFGELVEILLAVRREEDVVEVLHDSERGATRAAVDLACVEDERGGRVDDGRKGIGESSGAVGDD